MTLKGFASINATKLYSEKYKELKFNSLGNTGLFVSEIGFGGYKIDIRSPLNRDALKKALLSGINLIDTSSTYTEGNSELLVGDVLKEIISADLISRESVVVVTKCGFLQEQNQFFSNIEEYIEEQIKNSLERLNLKVIDVYLFENPENYLKLTEKNNIDKETARKKYYAGIKKTFEYLEKEVLKGRIKHYGISSNTFADEPDKFDFTSLEKIISIAEEISGDNHFNVIEFPMNLLEKNPALRANQANSLTLLELTGQKNLAVLIARPLNAFSNNKAIKLAEPIVHMAPTLEAINQEFENIHKLEKTILEKLQSYGDSEITSEIKNNLFIFDELANKWVDFKNISNWEANLNQYYLPRFHYYKNFIKNSSLKDEELEMDLFSCTFKIGKLFSIISSYFKNEHLKLTDKIKKELAVLSPQLATAKNLSNMAIRALRSTKGVTSVLVGMTQVPYVSDAANELRNCVNKDFNWDTINISID